MIKPLKRKAYLIKSLNQQWSHKCRSISIRRIVIRWIVVSRSSSCVTLLLKNRVWNRIRFGRTVGEWLCTTGLQSTSTSACHFVRVSIRRLASGGLRIATPRCPSCAKSRKVLPLNYCATTLHKIDFAQTLLRMSIPMAFAPTDSTTTIRKDKVATSSHIWTTVMPRIGVQLYSNARAMEVHSWVFIPSKNPIQFWLNSTPITLLNLCGLGSKG